MIRRVWHGWTPDGTDADAYQRLLVDDVVPGILRRGIVGLRQVDVLRRRDETADGEVEFVTVMTFDDWSAVEEFAGGDGTASVVPPAARALLRRFDERSQHYDLVGSAVAEAGVDAP